MSRDPGAPGRMGDWMQTFTGKAYYHEDPRPEDIDIEDIAHALGNLCRFGGHTDRFYSVAEHSYHVSYSVPRELALQGLMHDATEAYVVDIPRPLKRTLGKVYEELEAKAWGAISAKFNLPLELDVRIKDADNAVLIAEKLKLLKPPPIPWYWAADIAPSPTAVISGWPSGIAKALFLDRFKELTA